MKVRDLMTPGVKCAAPDASLQMAAREMKAMDIGCLPVCENDRLVGMLTDRDIVTRGVASGASAEARVRDVMTPKVMWCYDDEEVDAGAQKMHDQQIRRLPVLNRERRLVGILSLGDIAVRSSDMELAANTLSGVSAKNGETQQTPGPSAMASAATMGESWLARED